MPGDRSTATSHDPFGPDPIVVAYGAGVDSTAMLVGLRKHNIALSAILFAKSPQAHYRTMTIDDIAALPVGDLIAPNGVLFLWGAWPLIGEQAAVLRRWGFEPKTGGAWRKTTLSGKTRWWTGYLLRSVCEPFLIGALPGSGWRGASEPNI